MPSEPSAAPAAASPSDPALVERARRGDRRALAILYARHATDVHARAVAAGLASLEAARVLRDVFRRGAASLPSPTVASDFRGWLRGLTMDRIAEGRGGGPRLRPATTTAVQTAGVELTPAVRDAVWREIEQEWHRRSVPLWRRQPAALASAAVLGALIVAAAVVGLQIRDQIQPMTPAGAIALTAEPVEETATEDAPPPPAPSVIVPPVETEEPFVPAPEPEETATPTEPAPAPEPTETATPDDPSPEPSPTGSEPTEDPSSPPLLPLPGSGDASEEPSEPPTEDTDSGDTGEDGTGR